MCILLLSQWESEKRPFDSSACLVHVEKLAIKLTFMFVFVSSRTTFQSGLRGITCNCYCSVSNVAGEACWWSCHLKPALQLSTELVCVFLSQSLVCSYLTLSHWLFFFSLLFCLSHSYFFFFLSYRHCLFLVSFISYIYWISFSLSASICPSCPLYQSSQEAIVWYIPVFAVIDYGLSSFIGALLSCNVTHGSFFLWEPIYWWHLFRNDLLWVFLPETHCIITPLRVIQPLL